MGANREQDRVFPDPASYPIASRTLKFSHLSGRFLEPVQSSKVTVGVWRLDTKEYVSAPQTAKLMVDGCDFFLDESFVFTVTKTPELPDCVILVELTDKRMLRKHEVRPSTLSQLLLQRSCGRRVGSTWVACVHPGASCLMRQGLHSETVAGIAVRVAPVDHWTEKWTQDLPPNI
jgi:hypothetical protein